MTFSGDLVLQPLGLVVVLATVLHEVGRAGGRERSGRPWLSRTGFGIALVTLVSPLAHYAQHSLFVRALVDVSLAWVAAPVLVLGAPWRSVVAGARSMLGARAMPATGMPAGARAGAAPGLRAEPVLDGPVLDGRVLAGPVVAVVALLFSFWFWHVPAVLGPSAHSIVLRTCEYGCYLATGVVFWWQMIEAAALRSTWGWLGRIAMIGAVLAGMWLVAALMVYSQSVWYPAFGNPGLGTITAVTDQQLAGAAMWALPVLPLGVATFWCFGQWLRHDEDGYAPWRADPPQQLGGHDVAARVGMAAGAFDDRRQA